MMWQDDLRDIWEQNPVGVLFFGPWIVGLLGLVIAIAVLALT